jgi:hypothetical protein
MKLEFSTRVSFDAWELTRNVSQEDLLEFVTDLDEHIADWTFTLKLYEHFAALKKEHDAEQAEEGK